MTTTNEELEAVKRVTATRIDLLRRLSDLVGLQAPDLVMEIEKFVEAKIDFAKKNRS